ncbi:MAG: hypothetical protein V3V16_08775 [Melioribacteraceae bacterium]
MRKNVLILLFILLVTSVSFSQSSSLGEAKGVLLTSGVGPRFPIGKFADQQAIGVGFDVILSYTDNITFPFFLFAKVGYQNYPGEFKFYRTTDHSNIAGNLVSFSVGARHYFTPIIEDIVLLMPVLEAGATVAYLSKLHQYKIDSGRIDMTENLTKFGFHFGGGFTLFLMDIMANYNYLPNHQFISFDVRVTIPIAVSL